jgi:large subunit ribosomal protein L17
MRNRNKINQLGRTASHRNALMMNLANSLITHKRISTTLAKAKALRGYVEPLITKSKSDTTHSRRMVFSQLQNKEVVAELFREVGPKVGDRPGGYTRIIKTGFRAGDAAEMCIIELVDFNEIYGTESKSAAKKTRRSRRGSGTAAAGEKAATPAPAVEEAEVVEEQKEEAPAKSDAPAEGGNEDEQKETSN